jgi:hypothetical protein
MLGELACTDSPRKVHTLNTSVELRAPASIFLINKRPARGFLLG